MKVGMVFFFFFSSRRRHTRFSRDWSSDVCSSDLRVVCGIAGQSTAPVRIAANVNDLGAVDGEDLVQPLRRGEPRSFGPAGHGEPEDDSITVDFDTLDAGHGAIG